MNNVRLISTTEGGAVEIEIAVDDVLTWRAARWETQEISRLCSSRYGIRIDMGAILRPVLRENEELIEKDDGTMFIKTIFK